MSQCCTLIHKAITTPLRLIVIEMSKNRASENVYVTPVNMHHQLTLNSTTVSSGCSTTVLWLGILSASVGLTQLSGNLLPVETISLKARSHVD